MALSDHMFTVDQGGYWGKNVSTVNTFRNPQKTGGGEEGLLGSDFGPVWVEQGWRPVGADGFILVQSDTRALAEVGAREEQRPESSVLRC